MSEPTKTPLHDRLESMGGVFEEDGGWLWFETLGDIRKEYDAVRSDVGVWDLSPLIKWDFAGPQAAEAVGFINSNDLIHAPDGAVKYGPFLNEDGKVLDDGTIYKFNDDHLWVMTNSEDHAEHFAKHLVDFDVTITNITRKMPHLSIQGPRSRDVVSKLTGLDLSEMRYFTFNTELVTLGGAEGFLSRTGFSGELGYEFFTVPDQIAKAFDALLDEKVTPFGVGAIYSLRLEAGLLIPTLDYDPGEQTPYDIGLGRFVRMDKERFLGRAPLEAIAQDPPNNYMTLKYDTEGPETEVGAMVTRDGVTVGTTRAWVESPVFGAIGGAILNKNLAVAGDKVQAEGKDATVHPWGIYDPEKKRPRS